LSWKDGANLSAPTALYNVPRGTWKPVSATWHSENNPGGFGQRQSTLRFYIEKKRDQPSLTNAKCSVGSLPYLDGTNAHLAETVAITVC